MSRPTGRVPTPRQRPFIATTLALSLFLALCSVEIALRIIKYSYTPIVFKSDDPKGHARRSDWRYHHAFEDRSFLPDPVLIWRPKKNYPPFNAQGFRGPVFPTRKAPGDYYIVAIGDSNTLGPPTRSGWVEYLGETLGPAAPSVRVINAGVWGYSLFQGIRRFHEVLAYQPDLILVSFGANDAHRVHVPDKQYVVSKQFLSVALMQCRVGQLLFALSDKLMVSGRNDRPLTARVSPEDYEALLNKLISVAAAHRVNVVLLTRPFHEAKPPSDPLWWSNFCPAYNQLTLRVAEDRAVPIIDLYALCQGHKEWFVDESHFTDTGYRMAATMIADHLRRFKLLSSDERAP